VQRVRFPAGAVGKTARLVPQLYQPFPPDQHPIFLIARHPFGIDELILQRRERLVVELEPQL
jgi:hypothetical protein